VIENNVFLNAQNNTIFKVLNAKKSVQMYLLIQLIITTKYVIINVNIIYQNHIDIVQQNVQNNNNMKYKQIENIVYLIVVKYKIMNMSNNMNVFNNAMENMLNQLIIMINNVIIHVNIIYKLLMQ
jgi:hypothetical protein